MVKTYFINNINKPLEDDDKCQFCGKKIDLDDDWQSKYGACGTDCYARGVGAESC